MQVAQALGPLPEWLELGPVTQVDGINVREVLNDFSYRPEWDRPPKYILADAGTRQWKTPIDRSDTRPEIEHHLPGRPISELRGIHSGKVAILFNGESLGKHDLWRIRRAGIPMIGMNRTHVGYPTYTGPQPEYLCVVDVEWLTNPKLRDGVRAHPGLINGSVHKEPLGWRVTRHPRMAPFSFDLQRDGYVGYNPCTTGFLALQAAVYLGFTELFCLGLDMGGKRFNRKGKRILRGKHFDGSVGSAGYARALIFHRKQAPLLKEKGIKVWLCGSPESRLAGVFPSCEFEDLFAGN